MGQLGIALLLFAGTALAQSGKVTHGVPAPDTSGISVISAAQIAHHAEALMAEAKASPAGIATVTLEKYPQHFTMLTVRTKSGGAEMHAKFADIFVVLDGEADVVTGGTIVQPTESAPGETRGLRVEGGASHTVHKGDVVHIAPNVPHQTNVPPGRTFTYFVVKIEQ